MRIGLKQNGAAVPRQAPVRAKRVERGFTLVELMIAGSILGFSVVSLYGAFSFGFGLIRLSQETVRADQILVQKLETLRLYNWSQTAPSGGIIPSTSSESFAPGSASPGPTYNVSISIVNAPIAESYGDTLRLVTVSVDWLSGKMTHTRSMTTLVSQYGIQTYKH